MAPTHTQHPSPQDLAAYAAGKLSSADARAVAAHLEACPDCRRAAALAPGASFAAHVQATAASRPTDSTRLPESPRLASVAPHDLPPELANHPRYRILRELGRGGMGVVYQARQIVMNRPVVIKVINKTLLDQPGAVERFHREVQAAAKLAHPNIVAAYDAEQAGDSHMLVMEFVPGQSLAEALHRKGPLPVLNACVYVRQAALGLQHAHEQRMVHRDIKPHNLMLTPKGQVKILDFGLAKLVSEQGSGSALTALNAYMGTPDYCAPEQATDAHSADIRADIYSLGCTLYCLLGGRPPFHEKTAVLTILAHLEKEPTPLTELRPDVPAALWAIVARMLAKDPARRYQTPAHVARALVPFCKAGAKTALGPRAAAQGSTAPGGLPVAEVVAGPELRQPSMTAVTQPPPRRWWLGGLAVALLGVLGLSVCVVGALFFWAGQLVGRSGQQPQLAAEQQPGPQPGEPARPQPAGNDVRGPGKVVTEERKVTDFTSLDVRAAIQVSIRQGETYRLTVTADNNLLPFIKTTAEGKELRIELTPGSWHSDDRLEVTVTMPALKEFRIKLSQDGKLNGEIRADKLEIDAHSGQAKLSGSGKDLALKAGGAAVLHLADFAADHVDAELSHATLAEVQAKARLDYNIQGASQLHYRGSPAIGTATKAGAAIALPMAR